MSAPAQVPILLDENHRYFVNGVEYPSVTTVLQLAGLSDFSAIPARIRDHALARGKATHAAIHYFLEGDLDESSLDPEVAPRLEAFKKFMFHSGFRAVPGMIERRVFHPVHRFCGTFDIVGELPALNRQIAIVDWKNSEPGMSGTQYQTAAYLLCIPGVFHRAGIRLKGNRDFKVETYSSADLLRDQAKFLAALEQLRNEGTL